MKKNQSISMKIEQIPISNISAYSNNARKISDQAVAAVAQSISDFGFNNPILVDSNMVIVAGHTRFLAAKKLKLANVPVVILKDLSEKKAAAFRLIDNRTAQFSEWDLPKLEIELSDLADTDLTFGRFDELFNQDNSELNDTSADMGKEMNHVNVVIVECQNETEQQDVFNLVTAKGYKCKISSI